MKYLHAEMKKDVRILISCFALVFVSLACGLFGPPPEGYADWDQWETQQAAISTMESLQIQSAATFVPPALTQSAANSNLVNAQATAAINNSSDSPQGGVNIYLQGHKDGEQEGKEDAGYETTINRQRSSLQFWQILAGGALCIFLGMAFLNAMTHR